MLWFFCFFVVVLMLSVILPSCGVVLVLIYFLTGKIKNLEYCSLDLSVCQCCVLPISSVGSCWSIESPASGKEGFCHSHSTLAQPPRHDNKMQSMKLTVAPAEQSTPSISLTPHSSSFCRHFTLNPTSSLLFCFYCEKAASQRHSEDSGT